MYVYDISFSLFIYSYIHRHPFEDTPLHMAMLGKVILGIGMLGLAIVIIQTNLDSDGRDNAPDLSL